MSSRYTLLAAAGTDPGQARKVNQDAVLIHIRPNEMGEALGLLVVADGMGGHQAGEIASQLAVETIRESLSWMLEQDDMDSTRPIPMPDQTEEHGNPVAARFEKRLSLAVQDDAKARGYARAPDQPARRVLDPELEEGPAEADTGGKFMSGQVLHRHRNLKGLLAPGHLVDGEGRGPLARQLRRLFLREQQR